ncbi:hypothetical protein KOR42_44510 [Thalassoglobus neptunius]|uniref:DNA alkylation repair enzyme n=1 Tax=Thalassoglobus neptunius TaxID=1938619 RepID=A0A5C5W0R5_9PLAN|nr:hypothetical protein [Thalassoglobus neptunius]TWT43571.1 hypothetical protein KOR42_44510 [Thalassoglobus neptunius]
MAEHSTESFSLKDQLFNSERVNYLADLFASTDSGFDKANFVRQSIDQLTKLELKQRVVHLASVLENFLSDDFRVATRQITSALPPPLDPSKTDNDFGDFIFAPLGEYVVRNGLEKRHVKLSLRTLKQLTMRFSMEDAIRSFINEHTEDTMAELAKWATDSNYHVRRLASEGTRPRLPWSGRLVIPCTSAIPLLDTLHADPTRYVTRSVANHLNDIAKTDPLVVIETLTRWKDLAVQNSPELHWMTKHALRTLIKKGDSKALEVLGFRSNPKIEISQFRLKRSTLKFGEALEFSFNVTAKRDEPVLIDYVIDFMKANGTTSPKVFKLKQLDLKKSSTVTIKKKHVLKANATTYKLYPGEHGLTLQLNGRAMDQATFNLRK